MERDEVKRKIFNETISKIPKEKLVFLDEAGIDDNDSNISAWNKKGFRVYGLKKGKKTKRLSMISALNLNKLKAPFLFEGSCTRDVFETYVEKILIPNLTAGQVLILDNATFHHGGKIKKLIESADCSLLYLPPYSPDLNPIEHFWNSVKNKIRRLLNDQDCDIYDAAISAFKSFLI